MAWKIAVALICSAVMGVAIIRANESSPEQWRGVDISMLYELEKAGATYYPTVDAPAPGDAITILRDAGCNWFRLRLFVDPQPDYSKNWGATQDLKQVCALSKRIKAVGGKILLDLHYSDTWADGVHQAKPKAWEGQDFDALEKTVYAYTRSVLTQLGEAGVMPDAVQIGNEIAGGILYPEGKLQGFPPEQEVKQWVQFSKLLNAGAKAVRDASTPDHKIQVMIHIHGGGHDGVPKWFFTRLNANRVDFDIVGLSFYPAWSDALANLERNLAELAKIIDKPVVLAETSYAAKPMDGERAEFMKWPLTPQGQVDFVRDLYACMARSNQSVGAIWWYPEARPVGKIFMWRDGAEGLFDDNGRPRPALAEFAKPKK